MSRYRPASFLLCGSNSSHWTCVGTQFYTSPIALTRGIYLMLSGGTTLETRGKLQGAYKLFAEHGTVIWLVWGMERKRLFVCAGVGHMQRCLIARTLAGLNQEIWYSNQGWVAIPTLVGITSYPFMHKYPGLPAWALANFLNRWRVVVVSQSQVEVCVLFVSVCQVLRVLVRSVLCCCGWWCAVLYAWVSASRCAWFYVYQCVWNCVCSAALRRWDRL